MPICSSCGEQRPKGDFSSKQLKLSAEVRRCKQCIDGSYSSTAPAASTTANTNPTATSTTASNQVKFPRHMRTAVQQPGVREALLKVPEKYQEYAIAPMLQLFRSRGMPTSMLKSTAMIQDMKLCMGALLEDRKDYFLQDPGMWDHAQAGLTATEPWWRGLEAVAPVLRIVQSYLLEQFEEKECSVGELFAKEEPRTNHHHNNHRDPVTNTNTNSINNTSSDRSSGRFPPRGDYKLFLSPSGSLPTTPAKSHEEWEEQIRGNDEYMDEFECVKCITGLFYHAPSKKNVGYLEGFLITRGMNWVIECDEASQELLELTEELFDASGKNLRRELRNSEWGDSLDQRVANKLMVISFMEIVPEHRSKGAFSSCARDLVDFMTAQRSQACLMVPGPMTNPKLKRRTTDVNFEQPGNFNPLLNEAACKKLMKNAQQMGFWRVGQTNWVAMIPKEGHPCWCHQN